MEERDLEYQLLQSAGSQGGAEETTSFGSECGKRKTGFHGASSSVSGAARHGLGFWACGIGVGLGFKFSVPRLGWLLEGFRHDLARSSLQLGL